MNSLHFPSVQYSSATLLYNVSTPLFSPNRLKQLIKHNPPPQHSSPTLLCNTSLQHSFSNTPQQHPSTTPQLYLASLCCRALQRQLEVVFWMCLFYCVLRCMTSCRCVVEKCCGDVGNCWRRALKTCHGFVELECDCTKYCACYVQNGILQHLERTNK